MNLMRTVAVLVVFGAARNGSAQQIRGRLVDAGTNRPVASARVSLHDADSMVVQTAMSDADGRWTLHAATPGVYRVVARRIGYRQTISERVKLEAGAEPNLLLELEPMAVALDAVTAAAAAIRRNLEMNGFFTRQKGNFGHFVGPEAIERRQAARITDLLTTIPGVQLVASGDVGPAQIGLRGSSVTDGALCRPRVYVDGLMYARGDSRRVRARASDATEQADIELRMDRSLSLDDIGHPSTIAAIEVYRSASQVPVQFGGTSVETLCGVIVIWTRTGGIRDP